MALSQKSVSLRVEAHLTLLTTKAIEELITNCASRRVAWWTARTAAGTLWRLIETRVNNLTGKHHTWVYCWAAVRRIPFQPAVEARWVLQQKHLRSWNLVRKRWSIVQNNPCHHCRRIHTEFLPIHTGTRKCSSSLHSSLPECTQRSAVEPLKVYLSEDSQSVMIPYQQERPGTILGEVSSSSSSLSSNQTASRFNARAPIIKRRIARPNFLFGAR